MSWKYEEPAYANLEECQQPQKDIADRTTLLSAIVPGISFLPFLSQSESRYVFWKQIARFEFLTAVQL
jgi:hypothetical protein